MILHRFPKTQKINFADCNGNFAGFDMAQQCCEKASYVIDPDSVDIASYSFALEPPSILVSDVVDQTEIRFRIVASGKPDATISFRNIHNGYYCHIADYKIGLFAASESI